MADDCRCPEGWPIENWYDLVPRNAAYMYSYMHSPIWTALVRKHTGNCPRSDEIVDGNLKEVSEMTIPERSA